MKSASSAQMKARMIDIHFTLLNWIKVEGSLKSYPSVNKGMFKAAVTLLHWGAITAASKDAPNTITPVGDMLLNHWKNSHSL